MKEIFPDHPEGQLISAHPSQCGIREQGVTRVLDMPSFAFPTPDLFAVQRTALWKRAWRRYVSYMAALTEETGSTFQVARNAEHRQLMFDALRTAQRRLLVLSDQLSPRMVDRRFIDELEKCLTRGVKVALVYHRPERSAQEMLARLVISHKGLRLIHVSSERSMDGEVESSHAK